MKAIDLCIKRCWLNWRSGRRTLLGQPTSLRKVRFITSEVKGKRYWYFDMPDGSGGKKRQYVGPADDPEIAQRIEDFKRDKDSLRDRRRMVASLTRQAGMIAPDAMSGDIVEAFRPRSEGRPD